MASPPRWTLMLTAALAQPAWAQCPGNVIEMADDAVNGDGWVNGALVKPVIPEPTPAPRQWNADNFRSGMTLAEKTKWDNNNTPEIITVKTELPQKLAGATELLDFLVASSVIGAATKTKIWA